MLSYSSIRHSLASSLHCLCLAHCTSIVYMYLCICTNVFVYLFICICVFVFVFVQSTPGSIVAALKDERVRHSLARSLQLAPCCYLHCVTKLYIFLSSSICIFEFAYFKLAPPPASTDTQGGRGVFSGKPRKTIEKCQKGA